MKTKAHGLLLSGTQSSSGKTAVTGLVLAALAARGLPVQPFKVGPDFIDPGYHRQCSGTDAPSRTLDAWLMGTDGIVDEVHRHGAGKISVVEGVMGLFDGGTAATDEGSTMEIARLLDWPVILVLPCAKAGRSLAAALRGFVDEAGPGRIAGVILNQIGGDSHGSYLREALAPLGLPILGAIPETEALHWPERHLGLQASEERTLPSPAELAALAERFLDLDGLLALLEPAPSLPVAPTKSTGPRRRLALARDRAFHFYYPANLEYLEEAGYDLVPFSPLEDTSLPADVTGLILGGGFPEVHAEALAQNETLRHAIRSALRDGLPCYAECGGLMYLAEELITLDGRRYPMVGAAPGSVEMTRRPQNFGYCLASSTSEGPAHPGHEFHYSRWNDEAASANLWTSTHRRSGKSRREGYRTGTLHASYVHLFWKRSGGVVTAALAETGNPIS